MTKRVTELNKTIKHLKWLTTECEDEPDSSDWVEYAQAYQALAEEYKKFIQSTVKTYKYINDEADLYEKDWIQDGINEALEEVGEKL